jgi:hypothetical protein
MRWGGISGRLLTRAGQRGLGVSHTPTTLARSMRPTATGYLHLSVARPLPAPAAASKPSLRHCGGSTEYE